jgi:hypothetical protein
MAWTDWGKYETLLQDDWFPGSDLKPGPTEHKAAGYPLNRSVRSKFCNEGSIMKATEYAEIANFLLKKYMFIYYDTVHNCDLCFFEYLNDHHI